jgi:hypothetical protein
MRNKKKKSIRKRTRPTNRSRGKASAHKKTTVRHQSRTVGVRGIEVSEVEVIRTDFKTSFSISRIDDLERRNGGFEIGCSDFEDLSDFGETEATTKDAVEEIFLPEYGGSD